MGLQRARRKHVFFFRLWAFVLLERSALVFGHQFVVRKLCVLAAYILQQHQQKLQQLPSRNRTVLFHPRQYCLNNYKQFCFIQGNTPWRCYDLFGGALCVRRSWEMIESAASHLWGVKCSMTHTFTVPLPIDFFLPF